MTFTGQLPGVIGVIGIAVLLVSAFRHNKYGSAALHHRAAREILDRDEIINRLKAERQCPTLKHARSSSSNLRFGYIINIIRQLCVRGCALP